MINISSLPPQQILFLKKLYIGLGYNNINDIDHCMSRIRIQINNPSLLNIDSYFLNLGAQGVTRNNNSIQLIYGKQSSFITSQLSALYQSLEDKFLLDLLYLLHGSNNINDFAVINSTVSFVTTHIPENLPTLIQNFSQKYNTILTVDTNKISLQLDNLNIQDFITSYNNITSCWDIIQNIVFFDCIDITNIQTISRDNFNLHITTLDHVSISDNLTNCGLDISNSSVSQNDIIIQQCSDIFIEIFEYYYQLQKNTLSDIDKI